MTRPAQFATALCLAALSASVAAIGAEGPSEHQVKAAFLLNFTRYVDWPQATWAGSGDPLVFCILGADHFEGVLEQTLSGKSVGGRPIQLRKVLDVNSLRACQVLFVGGSEGKHAAEISAKVIGLSVLTVGEANGFAHQGGVINFLVDDGRVRFEINPRAAARANLTISSKLLQLATIVGMEARAEGKAEGK